MPDHLPMNIQLTALICGILLFALTQPLQSSQNTESMQIASVIFANNVKIDAEIADNETLRQNGLMHRKHLAENHGMLFVYPGQAIRAVWMKNTLIPLDVLFLSENGKIVSLLRGLTPCEQTPCPISRSSTDAHYMLEVNAGFIDRHRIKVGQGTIIDYKHSPK